MDSEQWHLFSLDFGGGCHSTQTSLNRQIFVQFSHLWNFSHIFFSHSPKREREKKSFFDIWFSSFYEFHMKVDLRKKIYRNEKFCTWKCEKRLNWRTFAMQIRSWKKTVIFKFVLTMIFHMSHDDMRILIYFFSNFLFISFPFLDIGKNEPITCS